MSWIKKIPYEASSGKLIKIYDRIKGPNNYLDNILTVHSLRPHTLTGHMYLYKNVLHHADNTLPRWFLEALGIYVSRLNQCTYCIKHHSAGLKKLVSDKDYASIIKSLSDVDLSCFDVGQKYAIEYAKQLTLNPSKIQPQCVALMKEHGYSDGEVLEINQVVAYFNYANRTVLGLGVHTSGDQLGLSPLGDKEDDLGHL